MPTYARRRKQMQDRGNYYNSWEEQQKEKKVQKTLDEFDKSKEEDNGQDS